MIALISFIILIGGLAFFLSYHLIKTAENFFREADILENMISKGHDHKEVYKAIVTLSKKAYRHQMYSRIRELSKMYAIKYGYIILKS